MRPPFPDTPDGLLPFGADTFDLYQRLLAIRRRHAWLVDGVVTTRDLTNESVVVVVTGPEQTIELALNVSESPVPLPHGEVLAASAGTAAEVEPHGWAVSLQQRGPA